MDRGLWKENYSYASPKIIIERSHEKKRYLERPFKLKRAVKFMINRKFIPVNIAVLTVSDTRTHENDRSGDVLAKYINDSGHFLKNREILKDDRAMISSKLTEWCKRDDIDVVITTGGTGLTGRDVSVEAHRDIYEKEIDAFATMFTIISMKKIGTSAVQSRACAGVAFGTYLFALPGSPGACKDGWEEILKYQLDYTHKPCNFVEIMPRLDEDKKRK